MKEGWEYKKLGEICDFRSGFAFKSNKFTKMGEPIIRISDIQNEEIDDSNLVYFDPKSYTEDLSKYLIYPGDILIAMSGGTTGKLGINTSKRTFYLNQRVGVFRENKKYLNHRYLYYFLHTKSEESLRIAAGAAQPNLSTAQIKSFIIPVPPLSEQQSIVDYLDSAFAKIDAMKANAEKALNEAKALFQASLKEMLEPKEGWEEKTLKELGQTQTGTTPSKGDKDNYGDYMPFIRPSEIDYDGSGRIEYNSALKLSKKGANNGRVFDAHSIYMVCIGATIGKVGYGERAISCNQQINILTPNSSVNYKFAYYAMKNSDFQQKVIKEGTSSQATLPIINKGKWEKLSISYPSLSEQQYIVATLDSLKSKVDRLQENYDKISQECDALKQAILRQVFE